jgi:hypothetical protein
VSTDGTTWKQLICETESGFDFSRETTTAPRTKCDGAATGQNITLQGYTWSMNFDAIADDSPTSAQVTYADMQGYAVNGTLLYVRQQNAASTADVYQQGTCYLTELSSAHPESDFVTFTGTFSGHGDIDITQA